LEFDDYAALTPLELINYIKNTLQKTNDKYTNMDSLHRWYPP